MMMNVDTEEVLIEIHLDLNFDKHFPKNSFIKKEKYKIRKRKARY
jgi:hypothetical protein